MRQSHGVCIIIFFTFFAENCKYINLYRIIIIIIILFFLYTAIVFVFNKKP